ncbi:DNA methylase [Cnuibacter physcomitrellae]|uniref:16S rRNA (Guanine(966)-N(2))-methyltransferase RsmD n=1 Tax=Cnuibacter physcomitrellae TaxID=1619308 RepID=A0A1X9LRT5_9MICO|nr:16S rRNA (guanine(966)-N(2))-methyltransferase RsmD [Cnuibacter physcomitrellae]ARJ05869.1 16S rRNA (guanine(966)-N(2))-methyltransferase RsmD [Cnuibacter physcomitrellae]GGI36678.1 DNA methylase [Cnuibacter physcomitrellae]
MTRIIAGFAGSLSLAVPKSGTRPTSDRVREAIFSALESRGGLDGDRVLDLYAGSGALGLESASRGASHVVLVERNQAAARVAKANAAIVRRAAPAGLAPTVEVSTSTVAGYLAASRGEYDVVFLDPPYDVGETELGEALSALVPRLASDAVVLVERSSRSTEPRWPEGLVPTRDRSYGETTLWWAARA